MAISFTCGTCGKPYKVDERFAGKKAACRACRTVNKIPLAGAAKLRAGPPDGLRSVVQSEPVRVAPGLLDDDLALPLAELDEDPVSDDARASASARDEGLDLLEEPAPPPVAPKPAPR